MAILHRRTLPTLRHLLPTVIILLMVGTLPPLIAAVICATTLTLHLIARRLRRAARQVDRIFAEELARDQA